MVVPRKGWPPYLLVSSCAVTVCAAIHGLAEICLPSRLIRLLWSCRCRCVDAATSLCNAHIPLHTYTHISILPFPLVYLLSLGERRTLFCASVSRTSLCLRPCSPIQLSIPMLTHSRVPIFVSRVAPPLVIVLTTTSRHPGLHVHVLELMRDIVAATAVKYPDVNRNKCVHAHTSHPEKSRCRQ